MEVTAPSEHVHVSCISYIFSASPIDLAHKSTKESRSNRVGLDLKPDVLHE